MEANELVDYLNEYKKDVILKNKRRIQLTIDAVSLENISRRLISDLHFRLITASGMESKEGIEILYHFSDDSSGLIASIRVVLPTDKPEIISLAPQSEAFNWIEREMHELLGIDFIGHPAPEKLISDGNWEEGEYPFRK